MTDESITTRIETELVALKIEEATLNHKCKNTYHFGEGTFELLPVIERVRKRKVELEDALKVMEEFK